jgi:hypothetical protein
MYNYHLPITGGLLVKGSTFFEFFIKYLDGDVLFNEFKILSACHETCCCKDQTQCIPCQAPWLTALAVSCPGEYLRSAKNQSKCLPSPVVDFFGS